MAEQRAIKRAEVEAFLNEIEVVCRKHDLSIRHEDTYGGFEIHQFEDEAMAWLRASSRAYRERPVPND